MGRAQHLKKRSREGRATSPASRQAAGQGHVSSGILRKPIPCMGLNFTFKNTATLDSQEEYNLYRAVAAKPACPRKPLWTCTLGGVLARKPCDGTYRAHERSPKSTKNGCVQGQERRKSQPPRALHSARPLPCGSLGHPARRLSPASPAPSFRSTHSAGVSAVWRVLITARNCSPGAS